MYGFPDPATQAWLVLDEARTAAFARAVGAVVRPGDVVLDVGTGSGILALLAAKAGARRVFAVEASSAAAELARRHVVANGLSGVVEVIRADLGDLDELPERPRVIVSETLGQFAPDENLHTSVRWAMNLAMPDAVCIPAAYRLVFAAARSDALAREVDRLRNVHGVGLPDLAECLCARVGDAHLTAEDLAGPEVEGPSISVLSRPPEEHRASVPIRARGDVTGIAVSFAAALCEGVELRTGVGAPPTGWGQALFPVQPALPCEAGETIDIVIQPRVVTDRGTFRWVVTGRAGERRGDAMRAVLGDRDELLEQLGLRTKGGPVARRSHRLAAWAAALGGSAEAGVEKMAERLVESMPAKYPDLAAARAEVLGLLRAARALY